MTFSVGEKRGIGEVGVNIEDVVSENLIKITRFVGYEDNPITAYVYVWEVCAL